MLWLSIAGRGRLDDCVVVILEDYVVAILKDLDVAVQFVIVVAVAGILQLFAINRNNNNSIRLLLFGI